MEIPGVLALNDAVPVFRSGLASTLLATDLRYVTPRELPSFAVPGNGGTLHPNELVLLGDRLGDLSFKFFRSSWSFDFIFVNRSSVGGDALPVVLLAGTPCGPSADSQHSAHRSATDGSLCLIPSLDGRLQRGDGLCSKTSRKSRLSCCDSRLVADRHSSNDFGVCSCCCRCCRCCCRCCGCSSSKLIKLLRRELSESTPLFSPLKVSFSV